MRRTSPLSPPLPPQRPGHRLRAGGLLCLALVAGSARADLWAFVDAQGVTHFATEPLDGRYALFLRGERYDFAQSAALAGEDDPGAVRRAGRKIPPFKETQNYVKTVLALYRQLQPLQPQAPLAPHASARIAGVAPSLTSRSSRIRMTLPASSQRESFDEKQRQ